MRPVKKEVNTSLIVFASLIFFSVIFPLAAKERQEVKENIKQKYEFNIPVQPLNKSLNTLSDVSKISFLFPYDLIENKQGNSVQGYYNVQQALNLLLKDSNLEGELSNNKAFLIKPLMLESSVNKKESQEEISLLASIFSFIFSSSDESEEQKHTNVETESNDREETEVIQILGIKGSLDASVHVKRYADTVVDVITAEDIGQFSDDSIAGAIQRIPGVQIETDDAGTDGDRVSIRGLGPEFVNSTINGRRLLSSGNEAKSLRKMNFNIFPPSILAGVNVAKGQTAVRPEGGLAGQVDLQTLKPLKIEKLKNKNSFTSLSVRGSHNDIDDETGMRVSLLTTWRNDDENLAGFASIVTGKENNARDQLQLRITNNPVDLNIDNNGDGVQDSIIDNIMVPGRIVMAPIREDTERTAVALGLEYRPNDDVEVNWDLMYSNYDNKSHRIQNITNIGAVWVNSLFDMSDSANPALIINDDKALLHYADFSRSSGGGPIRNLTSSMRFNNDTQNLISGININWLTTTKLSTNFDAYISTVDYHQDLRFPAMTKNLDKSQFIYDGMGALPNAVTPDITNVAGYRYSNTLIREVNLTGDNVGFTLKFDYLFDSNTLFSSVDFGSHYDKTTLNVRRSNAERITGFGSEIMKAAVTGEVIKENFFDGDNYNPSRWLLLDYDAAATVDPRINNYSWDELGINRLESYDMTESIFAIFGQLNIDSEVNDMPLTGNIGVRAVLTDNQSIAAQSVNGENSPIKAANDYFHLLPSVNLSLALNENMALRFGLSKSLSRPDYQQLAPINTVNYDDEQGGVASAIVGNPYLDAMTSINYDVTFEWYNEYDSAFVLSTFYKDVSDFIFSTTQRGVSLPGYEGVFDVTTYSNYSDGTAKGYEISLYQPLEKLLPSLVGFGFSTNYTFVDSTFDEDVGDNGLGFPGSSQDNFNFIAFYETDLLAIRLAYVYRSKFLRSLAGVGSQTTSTRFTDTQEKLDLTIGVQATRNLALRFSANNLTNDKRRDTQDNNVLLATWDRGRTYSLEVNYSF